MIKNVVVCINKDGVFARRADEDYRRGEVFYVQDGMVVQGEFSGI